MVLDLPLDAIAPDHLARDRMPAEDEEMAALRESLRAHGQRTPIEVTPLSGRAPLRPHLRLAAAHRAAGAACRDRRGALRHRPGAGPPPGDRRRRLRDHGRGERDPRSGSATTSAPASPPAPPSAASSPREKAALLALFATASRAKRSRIRAFLDIYHALDGSLRFPAALPERLGLRLVEKVRAGQGAAHRRRHRPRRPRHPGGRGGGARGAARPAAAAPFRGAAAPARRRPRHGAPGPCPDAEAQGAGRHARAPRPRSSASSPALRPDGLTAEFPVHGLCMLRACVVHAEIRGRRGRGAGGERGIRTLETVPRLHTFQACAFDHSATSPARRQNHVRGKGARAERYRRCQVQ